MSLYLDAHIEEKLASYNSTILQPPYACTSDRFIQLVALCNTAQLSFEDIANIEDLLGYAFIGFIPMLSNEFRDAHSNSSYPTFRKTK